MFTSAAVAFYTAVLLHFGSSSHISGSYGSILTCNALDYYSENGTINSNYLDSCEVLPEDSMTCQKLTCVNTDNTQLFSSLTVTIIPCGESGRKPIVLITASDFSEEMIINRTFSGSANVLLQHSRITLRVILNILANGIYFGLDLAEGADADFLLAARNIPIDYSEFSCPSNPNAQQPAKTCDALRNVGETANPFLGTCERNPSCLSVRCVDSVSTGINYYGLTIFPCSDPPSVQVLFVDAKLVPQIDATVSQTTREIPFTNSSLGTLTVTIVADDDRRSIVIGVTATHTSMKSEITYFSIRRIPISTSQCPAENGFNFLSLSMPELLGASAASLVALVIAAIGIPVACRVFCCNDSECCNCCW